MRRYLFTTFLCLCLAASQASAGLLFGVSSGSGSSGTPISVPAPGASTTLSVSALPKLQPTLELTPRVTLTPTSSLSVEPTPSVSIETRSQSLVKRAGDKTIALVPGVMEIIQRESCGDNGPLAESLSVDRFTNEPPRSTSGVDWDGNTMVMRETIRLPDFTLDYTVFLNGWRFRYLNGDHHVANLQVSIENLNATGATLRYDIRGVIEDSGADDEYELCVTHTLMAWNASIARVLTLDRDPLPKDGYRYGPGPGAEIRTKRAGPLADLDTPMAVPRGFRFGASPAGSDRHLLQLAYDLHDFGWNIPDTESIISRAYGLFTDNDTGNNRFTFDQAVSQLAGNDISVTHPPFDITPASTKGECGDQVSDVHTSEHVVRDIPHEFAVPILTGWDLSYPCDDEEVEQIGAWVHDVRYRKDANALHGDLHYKVSTLLRDSDGSPGHRPKHRVTVLGISAPRMETQPARWERGVVGADIWRDQEGFFENFTPQTIRILGASVAGPDVAEFELVYSHEFLDLVPARSYRMPLEGVNTLAAAGTPIEIRPGHAFFIEGYFRAAAPTPAGTTPATAWVTLYTDHPDWPSIRIDLEGNTL